MKNESAGCQAFLAYMAHKQRLHVLVGLHVEPKFVPQMYIELFTRKEKENQS